MAEANEGPQQGNVVPYKGDHDRVQMLSVKADGTLDQHNPELIGDRDATLAATKRQFAEQAVSAADVEERLKITGDPAGLVQEVDQDPAIAEAQERHQQVAGEAEAAAEAVIDQLHTGSGGLPSEGRDSDVPAGGPAQDRGNTATTVPPGERQPVDKR